MTSIGLNFDPSDPTNPPPLTVAFSQADGADESVSIDEVIEVIQTSPLLTPAINPDQADLRVEAYPNAIYRFYAQRQSVAMAVFRIPVKRARALPRRLVRLLEHIAAYQNLLTLKAPNQALGDAIDVEFLQLVESATRRTAAEVARLSTNAAGEIEIKSGQYLAVAVKNRAPTPLYTYLITMNDRQLNVNLVYPYQKDMPARIRPDETLLIGSGPTYLIELQLPEGESSNVDLFKLWISYSPIQPLVMVMPPLGQRLETPTDPYGSGSRLDRDLRRVILGLTGNTPLQPFQENPWWSQVQAVRVIS